MTTARAEYLFALAYHNVPPPVVNDLTITDFGRLTLGIDAINDGEVG